MLNASSNRTLGGLGFAVLLAFVGLGLWIADIQILQHERLAKLAADNLRRKAPRPARRGAILDSRGTVLATSIPTKTVCADPSLIFTQRVLVARTIAPLLDLPESQVLRQLEPRLRKGPSGLWLTNCYVVLKHKVPLERWQQITQAMAGLDLGIQGKRLRSSLKLAIHALRTKAIFSVDDHLRQYPSRSLAASVLGFVASGELGTDNGSVFEDHGVTGIELTFDNVLSGVHGWRTTTDELAPRHGLNVVLTLDARVQHAVEEELARTLEKYRAASACCIVVRPRTGEILALANLPGFDPNRPGASPNGQRNHAIADLFEPGSTFKIVTITTALNDRLLRLEDTVHCENGRWLYANRYLHDHHPYGVLSFEKVITKSSNIGTAKAALRLGPARLYETITNFGFGRITGIPLPAESAGVVRPTNLWNRLSVTRIPIGHEVSATPLQMVMAMAAIATGGTLMQPKLVDRLVDEHGTPVRVFPNVALRQVATETACAQMTRALKTVASEEGTARTAQLDYYSVAGKTGTTEKFSNGTYKSSKYYASFIGFLPADHPELCIIVGVDEPDPRVGHMGGAVAAPVFAAVAERTANYLRLPPDLAPEPETTPTLKPKSGPNLAGRSPQAVRTRATAARR
ncbi:MAG TPA: penicillin-binding protein 2 [Verrucomicrobiota bacterium]|nr:penicillin-binding protein 2 [Verrucomicrobiota bacterium]HNU52759.1 penicillin-binding protein 2 [Verrucomicrobiota bacterium]